MEELLEILPKPLFDDQDGTNEALGGLEGEFVAIRKSSSGADFPACVSPIDRAETSSADDIGFFVVPSPKPMYSDNSRPSSVDLPKVRVFTDDVSDEELAHGQAGSEAASVLGPGAYRLEARRLRKENEQLRAQLSQQRRASLHVRQSLVTFNVFQRTNLFCSSKKRRQRPIVRQTA